jgi:hypothetical protein
MTGFNASEALAIEAAIPIAAVNFLGSIFAVTQVDRMGRRGVLMWSLPATALFLLGLAVGFYLIDFTPFIAFG